MRNAPLVWIHCQKVRNLIDELDLKMWWVAEQAGIHKTTLRRWLRNSTAKVRDVNMRQLAAVLSTPCSDIIIEKNALSLVT